MPDTPTSFLPVGFLLLNRLSFPSFFNWIFNFGWVKIFLVFVIVIVIVAVAAAGGSLFFEKPVIKASFETTERFTARLDRTPNRLPSKVEGFTIITPFLNCTANFWAEDIISADHSNIAHGKEPGTRSCDCTRPTCVRHE